MGYVRQSLKLVFDESTEDLAGLEVRMRRMSVDQLLSVSRLANVTDRKTLQGMSEQDQEAVDTLFTMFADRLIEWNVEEEDGTPVPPTWEGVRAQDPDLIFGIVNAWMDAASGVSGPLGRKSNGGNTSVEPSIPMEPLSESPPS